MAKWFKRMPKIKIKSRITTDLSIEAQLKHQEHIKPYNIDFRMRRVI
jgi:hypothetical protein